MSNDSELKTVYIPKDKVEHLVIKTLLESSGIECFMLNEGVQNLFGFGEIGGYNLITGPIQIQVTKDNVNKANNLINEGFADKDDINRNNIPLNCPAYNSIMEGLLQCPDYGLALFQNQL